MLIAPRALSTTALFLLLTLALAPLGCGSRVSSGADVRTELVPVKGKVTYKGQPVAKGTVTFEPDDYGRPATGPIPAEGTFTLGTYKPGDGAVPGHHRITITETGIKSPRDALATRLASPAASGLSADVDAEHSEFPLEIH